MVIRKNSLPYPQSPTSKDQAAAHSPSTGALLGNTTADSQMDSNPWEDQRSPVHSGDLPPNRTGHVRENSLTNIPHALRPGGSGQDTPRSSIDSGESREWWDDDDNDAAGRPSARSPQRSPVREIPDSLKPRGPSPAAAAARTPPPVAVKRKPVPNTQASAQDELPVQQDFGSNNPFRRPSSEAPPPPTLAPPPIPTANPWDPGDHGEVEGKGKTPIREPAFAASITDFSRMSIHDGHRPDPTAFQQAQTPQEKDDPWKHFESPRPSVPTGAKPPAGVQGEYITQQPQAYAEHDDPWKQFETPVPQMPVVPTPAVPSRPEYRPAGHPQLIPDSHSIQSEEPPNPWRSKITAPSTTTGLTQHMQPLPPTFASGREEAGTISQGPDPSGSRHSRTSTASHHAEVSLLDDEDLVTAPVRPNQAGRTNQSETYAPPPGPPPGHLKPSNVEHPPPKPPRPTVRTQPSTEAEVAKTAEQRNETYQIKHFNWFDHSSGRLRRSSMLTQNKNGPCPLLALVNALILGARDESQAALDDALRSREQVSLGLIIETLMYELVDRSATGGTQLPDVDELNAFLIRLRTGMNANPRFVPTERPAPNLMDARNSMLHMPQQQSAQQKLGGFEATGDIKLYGAFQIPLIHGWLPEADAAQAFMRTAPTYEDAQAILFAEEELEYKLTRNGLTPDEQRVWEDITSIKNFFRSHPSQLTSTGLANVQQSLSSGSFAILFRNDHFSTIYKHPQSGQLFTLITDAGYAERDEIIWESLVDISGHGNEFFSGDFMPVTHHQAVNSAQQQHLTVEDPSENGPLSPQQQQEQHDADFAMALQLQEEEEQRQRAEQARRRRSGQGTNLQPGQSPRGSTGNIPITLTRSRQSQSDTPENRPTVPPRNQRQGPPAVSRPLDANAEDAPPAYEEAAKGRPYVPPVGSPLHPSSGPTGADSSISPMSSSTHLGGTANTGNNLSASNDIHPPGPNAPYYSSGGAATSGRRPMHGRIPSNLSTSGRSAYQDQAASTPTQQIPGAWSGQQRPSYNAGPYGSQQQVPPAGEGSGKRRRGDCIVM